MVDAETVDRSSTPRTGSDDPDTTSGEPESRVEGADESEPDAAAVRRAMRARGESIRRAELERAFDRLDAQGGLTDADRRVVARMAESIVNGVLAAPESALVDIRSRDGDPNADSDAPRDDSPVDAVANLFASER